MGKSKGRVSKKYVQDNPKRLGRNNKLLLELDQSYYNPTITSYGNVTHFKKCSVPLTKFLIATIYEVNLGKEIDTRYILHYIEDLIFGDERNELTMKEAIDERSIQRRIKELVESEDADRIFYREKNLVQMNKKVDTEHYAALLFTELLSSEISDFVCPNRPSLQDIENSILMFEKPFEYLYNLYSAMYFKNEIEFYYTPQTKETLEKYKSKSKYAKSHQPYSIRRIIPYCFFFESGHFFVLGLKTEEKDIDKPTAQLRIYDVKGMHIIRSFENKNRNLIPVELTKDLKEDRPYYPVDYLLGLFNDLHSVEQKYKTVDERKSYLKKFLSKELQVEYEKSNKQLVRD